MHDAAAEAFSGPETGSTSEDTSSPPLEARYTRSRGLKTLSSGLKPASAPKTLNKNVTKTVLAIQNQELQDKISQLQLQLQQMQATTRPPQSASNAIDVHPQSSHHSPNNFSMNSQNVFTNNERNSFS